MTKKTQKTLDEWNLIADTSKILTDPSPFPLKKNNGLIKGIRNEREAQIFIAELKAASDLAGRIQNYD